VLGEQLGFLRTVALLALTLRLVILAWDRWTKVRPMSSKAWYSSRPPVLPPPRSRRSRADGIPTPSQR
jgi:hypothetical protein